jgi:hypothetical protein
MPARAPRISASGTSSTWNANALGSGARGAWSARSSSRLTLPLQLAPEAMARATPPPSR